MLPTLEEFARSLTPAQLQFIQECIQFGLAEYADAAHYSDHARRVHLFTPSLRAQIRNGHIVYEAYRRAIENPNLGIQPTIKNNRRLFYINGTARLSFKKLDRTLRHRNYPTGQALAFDAQLWPDDGPEFSIGADAVAMTLWPAEALPTMTNVVGGYLANATETAFEVFIICPDGAGNYWEWRLNEHDIIELLKAEDAAKTSAARKISKRRLRLRGQRAEKQGTDDPGGQR